MYTCHQVAKYLLSLADEDEGDSISNLKLQKLLYYAQGLHLAMFGRQLFPEQIEAWQHGPVIPEVYRRFKENGAQGIPSREGDASAVSDKTTRDFLNEVYAVFGQYSAWKLREMTHREPPWAETPAGRVISSSTLKEYFKTQIIDDEEV